MSTSVAERTERDAGALIESVITKGDLSKLSPAERTQFYVRTCESMGLNPLTQPFAYIVLNGKMVLYAKKDCTDQLRKIHKISVTDMTETERDGVFVVTAKVQDGEGRADMAKGAVTLGQAKGDMLANLIMKAETKAKRRATLSICGLGFLDETEIETIPAAVPANGNGTPKRKMADISANKRWREAECDEIKRHLEGVGSLEDLEEYEQTKLTPEFMQKLGNAQYGVEQWVGEARERLTPPEDEPHDPDTGELPPSKAEFVQNAHVVIEEAPDRNSLLSWWNSGQQKDKRTALLTPKERNEMKDRVTARLAQMEVVV